MQLTLLATIGTAIVIVAIAAGVTARSGRARPALIGVGLAAVVVGLYLTGLTQLIADGVLATIEWFRSTPWTDVTTWGAALIGGGLLLAVIGLFLPRKPRATTAAPAKAAASPTRPVPASAPQVAPKPKAQATGQAAKGTDPEDAEIEELLRKRGIM